MLQLLWAFINVGAFLYFFINASRAIKLISEKHGILASIVLVIGLLGLIFSKSGDAAGNSGISRMKNSFTDRTNLSETYISTVKIKDNLISHVDLSAVMGKLKNNDSLVVAEAGADHYGFTAGYKWETNDVFVSPVPGTGRFKYSVNATERWSLLGVPFYIKSSDFEGEFLPVKSE